MHPNVHSSIIYNNQGVEAIQMHIKRRMNKESMLHTMECYSAWKEWNSAIGSSMNGPREYYD